MTFACGATPEIVNGPLAYVAFQVLPATVLAVCEPWPSMSVPVVPGAAKL